jgi:hypothetical protein
MAMVFICYRRDDSSANAGRVYDRLNARGTGLMLRPQTSKDRHSEPQKQLVTFPLVVHVIVFEAPAAMPPWIID